MPLITDDNREIIEIGLVVIDLEGDQAEPTAKFSSVVRPVLNPTLTQFCTRYTSIRQAEVDAAPSYPEASAALTEFVTQLDTLPGGWSWGSWGASDLELLERNAAAMVSPIRCRLTGISTSRRPSRPCATRAEERGRGRRLSGWT